MDVNLIKSKAAKLRKEHWGTLLLSDILTGIVALIPIIGVVAAQPVRLGAVSNYYNAYKGEETGWKKLYSKFEKQFESTVLYALLWAICASVFMVAIIIVGVIFSLISPIIGIIIMLLAFLLGIIILLGIENIGLILLLNNPEMKGNDAFKESFKYAKGYKMQYISVAFSYIGKMLLVIVTCGLYAIIAEPEISMAFIILTDEIINESSGQAVETNSTTDTVAVDRSIECSKCGTKNEPDAIYCEHCGNKLA